jgi:hypothetical protein
MTIGLANQPRTEILTHAVATCDLRYVARHRLRGSSYRDNATILAGNADGAVGADSG